MKHLLFVCLGNICRSPAAEGIMQKMIEDAGLTHLIQLDSAGTSGYHEGHPADGRMMGYAKQRGYNLTSRSRPFRSPEDFRKFDLILTMDELNYQDVCDEDSKEEFRSKIVPMTNYCKIHKVNAVPDPYYRGEEGFHLVLDILEDACENLLRELKEELGFKN